jgi:ABC-2 type transport system permease protein
MSPLTAVLVREGKIRATNFLFIFWDLFYPLLYMLVFGVAMTRAMGFTVPDLEVDYNAFFLAGVISMSSIGIASNTAWSFFLDRDNGIFYEMLTSPMTRSQYLIGKVLFNLIVAVLQAAITIALAKLVLDIPLVVERVGLLMAAVVIGTAAWFFFYAIFALLMRRNDAFNTVNSIFYFVFLFASSMFYPIEPLPSPFRELALANPVTWHVDVLRYATVGVGDGERVMLESLAFLVFTLLTFAAATWALRRQE